MVAQQNTLIQIDANKSTILAEVDSLAVAGSAGLDSYTTITRETTGNTISSSSSGVTDSSSTGSSSNGTSSSSSSSSGSSSGYGY